MDIFLLVIASAAIGIVVGTLSGLLGIGGGTILVPIFKLIFGLPAVSSTATSLFTIIPTSISGSVTHVRKKTCLPLLGVVAGIGGACTSPVGVWLASVSEEWMIMVAAAAVIGYSAITMFLKAVKMRKGASGSADPKEGIDSKEGTGSKENAGSKESADSKESTGSKGNSGSKEYPENIEASKLKEAASTIPTGKLVGLGLVIGAVAGVLSGYIGVGGGFLMVPLFMQLLGTPMKLTSGTSLIAVMILAIPGTVTNAMMGNIDWIAGIFVAVGAIPGAMFGSRMISKVPEFQLRILFGGFLIVAAILLVLNQLNIL